MQQAHLEGAYWGWVLGRLALYARVHAFKEAGCVLGQVGFEPTANRLKAEYSTTELLTRSCTSIVLGLRSEDKFLFPSLPCRSLELATENDRVAIFKGSGASLKVVLKYLAYES
jgi:hypothetical protein